MLKRLYSRLFPDSACEHAIIDMSLSRLRNNREALAKALREDGMKEERFFELQCEAIACLVNASKVEVDLAGSSAKRRPRYEAILAGVVIESMGARTRAQIHAEPVKRVIRRCARHLFDSMEECRTAGDPPNDFDRRSAMLGSLVMTSLIHLGFGDEEGDACLGILTKLTMEQAKVAFHHIRSNTP